MRTLCCFCFVLTLLDVSALAQDERDWADNYRDAIGLVSKRQWKEAEELLLRAIKAGPASGRNVIRRGVFGRDDYFPEFYLGIIYLYTNRATEAQAQFQAARKHGINIKEREFASLGDYEARARELSEVENKSRAAAARGEQFKRLMGEARKLLAASRHDEAESAARQARDLKVDDAAADALLQNIQRSRSASRLQEALKRNPSLPELRRLLAEYEATGAPLDELRNRIETAEIAERRNISERAAMVAFYTGNYAQAVNALNEAEKTLALTPRGQFYRAVTLATQATRGKAVNQGLLQRARQAWQAASQEPGVFQADLKYISPEIIRQLQGK